MNVTMMINLMSYLSAFVITVMLLVASVLGRRKERVFRYFIAMLLANFIGILVEASIVFLQAAPGGEAYRALQILELTSYLFGGVMIALYTLYLYDYLSTKRRVFKWPFGLIIGLWSVGFLILAVGLISNTFSWFDEGGYGYSREIFALMQSFFGAAMICGIAVVARYRRALAFIEWVSMLSVFVCAVVCYAVEMIFPDLWVTYFGATLGLFIVYVNIQLELKRQLQEKDAELAEQRIAILLSQIGPHFLYNTLSAIEYLIMTDSEQAVLAIRDFSAYLRKNMNSLTQRQPIPFCEELAHVKNYLSLEKMRFEEKLRVVYEIEAEDFSLPPLTVQPIVENSVRHGLMKNGRGGTIRVRSEEAAECWRIIISDDGAGFDVKRRRERAEGVGLQNVRSRLKTICGGALHINSAVGAGTEVVIELPKERKG